MAAVGADGRLDAEGLITAFFREHYTHAFSASSGTTRPARSCCCKAHLQRSVNNGGRIKQDYGLGSRSNELPIAWPQGPRERRFAM